MHWQLSQQVHSAVGQNLLAIPLITTTGSNCICRGFLSTTPGTLALEQPKPRSMVCQPLGTAWQKRFMVHGIEWMTVPVDAKCLES